MEQAKIYETIIAVQGDLAAKGLAKDRIAETGRGQYAFRGIDDVYNVLAPLLFKHKLCILPRMLSREVIERRSAKGATLLYVTLEAEFDFISAEDGSKHTVRTFGEAMDSGDKATNKAMSAAYKYAAIQAFAIPTEGDNDSENHTHEIAASESISREQLAKLTDITARVGNLARLCEAMEIESLADLPARKFEAVMKRQNGLLKDAVESIAA